MFYSTSLSGKTPSQIADLVIVFYAAWKGISNLTVEENLDFADVRLMKKKTTERKNEIKGYSDLLKNYSRNKLKVSYLSSGGQLKFAQRF